ncbi:hypothetical protein [Vibrio penaeicida]|uniref:hypothetical protein n=1 Tax=Vibrio penaeicida TaxID=104609 RepID=UPI000CEA5839|nr:hypothetical protein [Vibrio penaeicida]
MTISTSIKLGIPSFNINWRDQIALPLILLALTVLIITFNVKGYTILFDDDPLFNSKGISPFGLLLGVTELAVLLWTYIVISKWDDSVFWLKWLVLPLVVISFAFLSYTGINSYLSALANSDSKNINKAELLYANSQDLVRSKEKRLDAIAIELTSLRAEQGELRGNIERNNVSISELSKQASERRQTAFNCAEVEDCANSVQNFQIQIDMLKVENDDFVQKRRQKNVRISALESQQDKLAEDIEVEKEKQINWKNSTVDDASTVDLKRKSYEATILTVTKFFGFEPSDPFGFFVGFLSALIYPVYFMLNLLLSLNSDENKEERAKRREAKNTKKKVKQKRASVREALLKEILKYLKLRLLRKKKSSIASLKERIKQHHNRKSVREETYKRMIKYMRVWARRRKKTKEIQVETIKEIKVEELVEVEKIVEVEVEREVEVPVETIVEIEKEVEIEKIVEVEKIVEKEVPVEVEKIVQVPTEVEIEVEKIKIKEVKVPYFINDPQVIVHERLVPVPEDVTAEELERILNAQPRLNTDARDSEESSAFTSEEEGRE